MYDAPSLGEQAKNISKHKSVHAPAKFFKAVKHFVSSVMSGKPNEKKAEMSRIGESQNIPISFLSLPDDIILAILSKCDSATKMNLRAVNHRLHYLVDSSARYCSRVNLNGGVEIEEDDSICSDAGYGSLHDGNPPPTMFKLRRTQSKREIRLPATRLTKLMRHVTVLHSLRLSGVSLNEKLTRDILDAKFRTVSHLVVDRVNSATSETLSRLVKRVYPSKSLHILNNSDQEKETSISPEVLDSCLAADVSIFAGNSTYVHRLIDDEALLKLILCEETVKRNIRLPHCAVTHDGINKAAAHFYNRCVEILDEMTDTMELPAWEVAVSLPKSFSINIFRLEVPADMMSYCTLAQLSSDVPPAFMLEIRVNSMCLRIRVE